MKLQLCLIALLWSMQSSMHAADSTISSEDDPNIKEDRVLTEIGANVQSTKTEAGNFGAEMICEGGGLERGDQSSNVSEDSQHQLLALKKYSGFNLKARNTDESERKPLFYPEDPAFGETRTESGHILISEAGSSSGSPVTEGVDSPPAAVSGQ